MNGDWSAYKERLLKGDCAVMVFNIREPSSGRAGIATLDLALGVLFLRKSRYLDRKTTAWTTNKLPSKKTKDANMEIGCPCDFLMRFDEVHEIYFLDEKIWRGWIEEERT